MNPIEVAKEAFAEAWKQVWADAAMLLVAIFALLAFCALVWLYFEYVSIRPR